MGISQRSLSCETMKAFVLACVAVAAVSGDAGADADAYTIAQVYKGLPLANAIATGHAHNPGYVAYTEYNTLNAGYGFTGYKGLNAVSPYYNAHHLGKRSADSEADAYTIGQVYKGLPFANAVATGHAHNPGYVAYTEFPANTYSGYSGYTGLHGLHGYSAYLG